MYLDIRLDKEDFKRYMTRDRFIEIIKTSIPKLINDDYNFSYVIIGEEIKNILYSNSELKTEGLIDIDKDNKGRDIRIYFSPYIKSSNYLMGFNYGETEPSYVYMPFEKLRKRSKKSKR